MPYFFDEHTADIRMNVRAKTLEQLFCDAFFGMVDVLRPNKTDKIAPEKEINIEDNDTTTLLIDFLNEVLLLMNTEHAVYDKIEFLKISEAAVRVRLTGYIVKSFDEDIKAVTYHEADVKKNEQGELKTTIVFDV